METVAFSSFLWREKKMNAYRNVLVDGERWAGLVQWRKGEEESIEMPGFPSLFSGGVSYVPVGV